MKVEQTENMEILLDENVENKEDIDALGIQVGGIWYCGSADCDHREWIYQEPFSR